MMMTITIFQVLASECCDISYNDLDLIFTVDLPTQKHYERVSAARGGEAIILF